MNSYVVKCPGCGTWRAVIVQKGSITDKSPTCFHCRKSSVVKDSRHWGLNREMLGPMTGQDASRLVALKNGGRR